MKQRRALLWVPGRTKTSERLCCYCYFSLTGLGMLSNTACRTPPLIGRTVVRKQCCQSLTDDGLAGHMAYSPPQPWLHACNRVLGPHSSSVSHLVALHHVSHTASARETEEPPPKKLTVEGRSRGVHCAPPSAHHGTGAQWVCTGWWVAFPESKNQEVHREQI